MSGLVGRSRRPRPAPMNIGDSHTSEIGVFRVKGRGRSVVPVDGSGTGKLIVKKIDSRGAADGELVEYLRHPGKWGWAKIVARLGEPGQFASLSEIAMRGYGIAREFPGDVLGEAAELEVLDNAARTDLRHLDFVTIDPEDARDRDDAVFAESDPDSRNQSGYVVWVAIADVAHFVRPGTAIDREAMRRGNSTYFPDFAAPMLPDLLSGLACSLHAGQDRPCIAVRMVVDRDGNKVSHEFVRGLIRSRAALSYECAQELMRGNRRQSEVTPSLKALHAAFAALANARARRQPLELDLTERRVVFADDGTIAGICPAPRFETHRLIEEFMVLANVCAAETLEKHRVRYLCRAHDGPESQRIDELARIAGSCGLRFSKSDRITAARFNRLLAAAAGTEYQQLINTAVLRTMSQAAYRAEPGGHFGLNLRRYAHFTSPIRRYADLITHRLLIRALGLGDDGMTDPETSSLAETAFHVSNAERRSAAAERDTLDRFAAAFLVDRINAEFTGSLTTVARFGAFVRLDETGAEGLVPARRLGSEYFRFNPDSQTFTGARSGKEIRAGARVKVTLSDADPVTGRLTFDMSGAGRTPRRAGGTGRRGKGSGKGRR